MPTVTTDTVIRRREGILSSAVDDEIVMMDADKGVYYGFDSIGSNIWNFLAKPVTPAQLVAELAGIYEGNRDDIEHDVLELLERLAVEGLLEIEGGGAE